MNKKDCNIIVDLLPGYIENDVTADTKEFIEEHIKNCKDCKNVLDNMKEDIIQGQYELKDTTTSEIKKIKKVKRNLKTYKIVLVVSSIIVLILAVIFLYNQVNKTLYDKIRETYNANESLNNYRIIERTIYKNLVNGDGNFDYVTELYCKDGDFKTCTYYMGIDTDVTVEIPKTIEFGQISSREYTKIYTSDNEVVRFYNSKDVVASENSAYESSLKKFRDKNVEIKVFNEKEWYVCREDYESGYKEYWINKDNLTDTRIIESYDKYYREILYTFEKNIVTDKDMKIDYDTTNFKHKEIHVGVDIENKQW